MKIDWRGLFVQSAYAFDIWGAVLKGYLHTVVSLLKCCPIMSNVHEDIENCL